LLGGYFSVHRFFSVAAPLSVTCFAIHINTYSYFYAYTDAYGEAYTDSEASSYTAAEAVVVFAKANIVAIGDR
jgi:hypothetical protein